MIGRYPSFESGRSGTRKPRWDILHPGRPWANALDGADTDRRIVGDDFTFKHENCPEWLYLDAEYEHLPHGCIGSGTDCQSVLRAMLDGLPIRPTWGDTQPLGVRRAVLNRCQMRGFFAGWGHRSTMLGDW